MMSGNLVLSIHLISSFSCQARYTLGLVFLELLLLSRLTLKKYKSGIDFVFRLDMGVRLKKCRFSVWYRKSI